MNNNIPGDGIGPAYVVKSYNAEFDAWGFLVVDNLQLGPGKGGIRMTPSVTELEVARLARAMTYKNAVAGLAFGGAKAGIAFDPKTHTKAQKKKVVEWFARTLKPLVPKLYIAGPDINMGETDMQTFAQAVGTRAGATGKPARMGGLPHELGSTGYGVALATRAALEFKNIPIAGATVAIEGYGNVGTFAHQFLSAWGAKVVAVSDSQGLAYSPTGLDYKTLMAVKKKTGSVINYSGAEQKPKEAIFELPVDVLIPGALPDVIIDANVDNVRAKIIVEGSNIPMSAETEAKLHARGILVIPDFVANAGGIISSYAEHKGWGKKKMFQLVEQKIGASLAAVLGALKKSPKTPPRDIALKLAATRLT